MRVQQALGCCGTWRGSAGSAGCSGSGSAGCRSKAQIPLGGRAADCFPASSAASAEGGAFSIEQLESFTPMAVAAISSMQMAELSDLQRSALMKTKAMEPRSLDFMMEQESTGSAATLCLKTMFLMLTATIVT
ncbi:hypothetical protein PR048_017597, partial [Dryococelus australis]